MKSSMRKSTWITLHISRSSWAITKSTSHPAISKDQNHNSNETIKHDVVKAPWKLTCKGTEKI